jgi:hypothetical protein
VPPSRANAGLRTGVRLPLLFAVQATALVAIGLCPSGAEPAATIVFGAVGGAMTLERAAVPLEWFGPENYGTRADHMAAIALPARAASRYVVELCTAKVPARERSWSLRLVWLEARRQLSWQIDSGSPERPSDGEGENGG